MSGELTIDARLRRIRGQLLGVYYRPGTVLEYSEPEHRAEAGAKSVAMFGSEFERRARWIIGQCIAAGIVIDGINWYRGKQAGVPAFFAEAKVIEDRRPRPPGMIDIADDGMATRIDGHG